MTLPGTPDDRIKSTSQLAQFATELTDHEVQQVGQIVGALHAKFSARANTVQNLDQLRDEALTRLAAIGILATLDPSPCFYGEPPILEIVGKVPGDAVHQEGFDHERKRWEVLESKKRGEDYRGQKEKHKG